MYARNTNCLERQIVSTALACRLLSRGEWRSSILRSCLLRKRSGTGRSGTHRSTGGSNGTTLHIVGTNVIKPTAVEFMGINIE